MTWKKYASPLHWHPAANAFALLPEDSEAFSALVADIKAHGLNNPIALFEGKVLDGRNRVRACLTAEVEPTFFTWEPKTGQTPETWSASQNIYRRHLTADQQCVGADELLRGHTLFKNMRSEYVGFEKEYSEGWKKVRNGEQSLATFVHNMDWLKSGAKVEERPFSTGSAAQTFLRLLSYETVLNLYPVRLGQLRGKDRKYFEEAWSVVLEGVYGRAPTL